MQQKNMEFVIEAGHVGRSPMANAVRHATEVGVVVPSILRKNLEEAGFVLVEDSAALADYGFASLKTLNRVVVMKDGEMVAMGAAGDHAEALLHAVLGYFRENPPAGLEPTEGIATAPSAG